MFKFNHRLNKIKSELKGKRLDGLIVSSVPNITYLTGFSNFSSVEREAYLLITKDYDFILTDGRYSEAIKSSVKDFKLVEVSSSSPFVKNLKKLISKYNINNVGIEESSLTVLEYKKLSPLFKKVMHFDIHHLFRSLKDEEEIKMIENACRIGDKTFDYILPKIKEGVTEKGIAFEIEVFIKRLGADISFLPIVAFGKNSSVPHHQAGNTKLGNQMGQFILLDFGAKFNNYCSDMTRAVFFGRAPSKQKKMYKIALTAQEKAVELLQVGLKRRGEVNGWEVDRVAREYIIGQGYSPIPHSLGHGIGLEVHEPPSLSPKSKHKLREGMVFSIEPGIYIEGFGGVRIEDLFVIENNKLRQLTRSPKNLIEL